MRQCGTVAPFCDARGALQKDRRLLGRSTTVRARQLRQPIATVAYSLGTGQSLLQRTQNHHAVGSSGTRRSRSRAPVSAAERLTLACSLQAPRPGPSRRATAAQEDHTVSRLQKIQNCPSPVTRGLDTNEDPQGLSITSHRPHRRPAILKSPQASYSKIGSEFQLYSIIGVG